MSELLEKTTFVTSDIYFCAYLLMLGNTVRLESIDHTDPKHVKFTFSSSTIDIAIEYRKWNNNELVGSLSKYSKYVKDVKNMLFSVG